MFIFLEVSSVLLHRVIRIDTNNTAVVNVGVVTGKNEFYGSGLGLTGIKALPTATNIYGGAVQDRYYIEAQPVYLT